MTKTKHYLEAFIKPHDDPQFRVICSDKETCSREREYSNACIFEDQYNYHSIDLIKWEDEEIILGRIPVKVKIDDPYGDSECWITGHENDTKED